MWRNDTETYLFELRPRRQNTTTSMTTRTTTTDSPTPRPTARPTMNIELLSLFLLSFVSPTPVGQQNNSSHNAIRSHSDTKATGVAIKRGTCPLRCPKTLQFYTKKSKNISREGLHPSPRPTTQLLLYIQILATPLAQTWVTTTTTCHRNNVCKIVGWHYACIIHCYSGI